jgi:hypothetical protein
MMHWLRASHSHAANFRAPPGSVVNRWSFFKIGVRPRWAICSWVIAIRFQSIRRRAPLFDGQPVGPGDLTGGQHDRGMMWSWRGSVPSRSRFVP